MAKELSTRNTSPANLMLSSEFQRVSKTIEQSSFPMPREYNNDDPNVFGNDEDMDEQEATDDGEDFSFTATL